MSTPAPRAAAVAAVVALALGGCSSDEPSASPSSPAEPTTTAEATTATTAPTTARPTTTTTPSEEDAILAAVDGFWQVLLEANQEPPNPDHPDLERYLTGAQLERTRANVAERLALGQAVRPSSPSRYSSELQLVSLGESRATVRLCGVDDGILYDRASGSVLNDATVTVLWLLTVDLVGGSWKVSDSQHENQWEGVRSC